MGASGWRVGRVIVAGVVVAGLAIVVGERTAGDGRVVTTATSVPGAPTPEAGIRSWLAGHRDELFPTYDGEYIGRCPESGTRLDNGALDALCSLPRDDLDERQIHGVGVYATNWGAELLLERSARGWSVIAAWPWGEPGDAGVYGPPWSPHTAIAQWWAAEGPRRYPGPAVAYVQDCATSGADASITEQTLVCSALVSATAGHRVYVTGPLADPLAVTLVLDERPDHTWAVSVRAG